jgi:NhaP-type Na+/H+ or K+/H+ antiporter
LPEPNPALTVGLALSAGIVAQIVARHLAMPGIVLLLLAGVLLGPDVANLIQPEMLGTALRVLVGFAVAVILFDGGLNLDIRRLRAEGQAIRRLVTFGAFITALGGTLAAQFFMPHAVPGWDWRLSALFGTLIIVTGPTVVTPLVRRLRLREPVSTILEAEGVLIDPIGAIIAVVALEVLYASDAAIMAGLGTAAAVLGAGALIGLIGGVVMALLLRPRKLVPPGLENIFVLSLVVTLFQLSDTLVHDSGLAAVVVAGIIVGNVRTRSTRQLLDFKEQLTVLMIGLLFVLLAADVRMAEVTALGLPALATVGALILIVRPLQVWACTAGSRLAIRERIFLGMMAPRGIVAAAVASLFAAQLLERDDPVAEGPALRALVFVVIAVTVALYGIAGGPLSRWLGLKQPTANGYAILGANDLAIAIAKRLRGDGHELVLIDSNVDQVERARAMGLDVIHGQGLQAAVLAQAEPDSRLGCIALTANEEVNLLFARAVRDETRVPAVYVALRHDDASVPLEQVHDAGATVLFGRGRRINLWAERFEHGTARLEDWSRELDAAEEGEDPLDQDDALVPIAIRRRSRLRPWDDEVALGAREEIVVAIDESLCDRAEELLRAHGFGPANREPAGQTV